MTSRIAVLAVLAGSVVTSAASPQEDLVERAGWLAGCWEQRSGNRATLEMWMPPAGGLMVGGSRTIVGGATREFEHVRIQTAANRLVYTAIPAGQQQASFPSVAVSDTLLVFENLEHDFPQRIMYRRRGADSVIARVEGPGPNRSTRGFDIPMRRVDCTASENQVLLFPRSVSKRHGGDRGGWGNRIGSFRYTYGTDYRLRHSKASNARVRLPGDCLSTRTCPAGHVAGERADFLRMETH